MNTLHDSYDGDPFAVAYIALTNDLGNILDLASGHAATIHPSTYEALTDSLAATLHVDAGLTAITGNPAPPTTSAEATTSHAPPLPRLADQLASLTDLERLSFRTRPSSRRLRGALVLMNQLSHALDLGHDLDRDFALTRLSRRRTTGRNRVAELDHALDRARHSAERLDADLELDRAYELVRNVRSHLLRSRLTSDHLPELTRELVRVLNRSRAGAVAFAHNVANDLGLDLGLDLELTASPREASIGISRLLTVLAETSDNFAGADLRAATDFDSIDWTGVRWSSRTRWPHGWEERIRVISIEITPGIFEVGHDGRHSLHEIST